MLRVPRAAVNRIRRPGFIGSSSQLKPLNSEAGCEQVKVSDNSLPIAQWSCFVLWIDASAAWTPRRGADDASSLPGVSDRLKTMHGLKPRLAAHRPRRLPSRLSQRSAASHAGQSVSTRAQNRAE